MAEPSTTTAIVVAAAAGAGLAATPWIDGYALVGGFFGALFFVVFNKDPSFLASVGYLMTSWAFGYFAAGEATAQGWSVTSGMAAMGSATVFVTVATGVLQWFKGGKMPTWWKYIPRLKWGDHNGDRKDG